MILLVVLTLLPPHLSLLLLLVLMMIMILIMITIILTATITTKIFLSFLGCCPQAASPASTLITTTLSSSRTSMNLPWGLFSFSTACQRHLKHPLSNLSTIRPGRTPKQSQSCPILLLNLSVKSLYPFQTLSLVKCCCKLLIWYKKSNLHSWNKYMKVVKKMTLHSQWFPFKYLICMYSKGNILLDKIPFGHLHINCFILCVIPGRVHFLKFQQHRWFFCLMKVKRAKTYFLMKLLGGLIKHVMP